MGDEWLSHEVNVHHRFLQLLHGPSYPLRTKLTEGSVQRDDIMSAICATYSRHHCLPSFYSGTRRNTILSPHLRGGTVRAS